MPVVFVAFFRSERLLFLQHDLFLTDFHRNSDRAEFIIVKSVVKILLNLSGVAFVVKSQSFIFLLRLYP